MGHVIFATDMCDGESQGHDRVNYSLASRDMITNMVELQCNATPFDGGAFIAGAAGQRLFRRC